MLTSISGLQTQEDVNFRRPTLSLDGQNWTENQSKWLFILNLGECTINNSMMIIAPYWYNNTWVFDDESKGLKQEPFVLYIPEMISDMVRNIPGARKGFKLIFSAYRFPEHQIHLEWVREESGGNWYRIKGQTSEGWLCPALFKYFNEAPKNIFAKGEKL